MLPYQSLCYLFQDIVSSSFLPPPKSTLRHLAADHVPHRDVISTPHSRPVRSAWNKVATPTCRALPPTPAAAPPAHGQSPCTGSRQSADARRSPCSPAAPPGRRSIAAISADRPAACCSSLPKPAVRMLPHRRAYSGFAASSNSSAIASADEKG